MGTYRRQNQSLIDAGPGFKATYFNASDIWINVLFLFLFVLFGISLQKSYIIT